MNNWLIRPASFLLLILALVLVNCDSDARQTTPTENSQRDPGRGIIVDNEDLAAELDGNSPQQSTRMQPSNTPPSALTETHLTHTPTAAATAKVSPTPAPTPTLVPTTGVLFVGNSLTFSNNLPDMFAELARSGGHKVEVDLSAQGGWTCSDHASSPMTLDKVKQQNWDFVVLQEQSVIPALPDQRNEEMYPAVRILDRTIRESGANTVLFMAWAHREGFLDAGYESFADMQAQVEMGYVEIAHELDALVAPVGIAWQNGMVHDPQLDLWQTDGIHPNREGSYLAACVFYAVVFQQSPEGLTYRADLSDDIARFLQAIAAESVLENPERWNIP